MPVMIGILYANFYADAQNLVEEFFKEIRIIFHANLQIALLSTFHANLQIALLGTFHTNPDITLLSTFHANL